MYLALARKYRPQKFADLIGQPHITQTLQNAISMNKLYPGLIFSGMKGVGKTSAARILSKALNCEKGPAIEPCNECAFCTEITEDKSPDYIEIDGASNNGVEEVRSLKERVKYKPLKNRFRIVVIDEVHMLSNSAWNALLKTIEEPPEHTYFIMATTDFHKIPATIVSRCQHFEFKRIPLEVIKTLLREICIKENITITDYSLYLIAKSSEGGLRDAKKILDQAIALSNGDVDDQSVIDILGVIDEEIFIELTRDIFSKNRQGIIEKIHTLAERGMDLRFFYNEYLKFFRDLLVLKSLGESEKLHNLNPENIPLLKDILKNVRDIELLRYFNAAKDLEMSIKNTENPRIILEYLFLKLSYFPSLLSIEELIEKTRSGDIAPLSVPRVMDIPPIGEDASSVSMFTENDGYTETRGDKPDIVTHLLETLKKEKPRLAANLASASVSMTENKMVIKFPPAMESAYRNTEEHIDEIKELFMRTTRQNVEINAFIDKAGADAEEARLKQIENDPKITGLAGRLQSKMISVKKI